jgi:hypothetical protein
MLVAMGVFLICFVWAVKKAGKGIVVAGLLLLIFTLGTELLVLLELSGSSPDLTYGSDARYYYSAALAVLENKKSVFDFSAPLYVAWEVFVLQSSPSINFVYILFANAFLFVAAYFCQVVALFDRVKDISFFRGVKERLFVWSLVVWTNGIVLWTVARGLKEVLILFIISSFLVLLYKSRTFWKLYLPLAAFLLYNLRPMGFVLPLVAVGAHYLFRNIGLWQLLFLLLFIAAVGEGILSNLDLLLYFSERFGKEAAQKFILGQEVLATPVVGFLVAMLRFVLGPGPFRSLQQILYGNVFEVSTRLGDLLIFLGSFAWWGLLLAVLVGLFISSKERSLFSLVVSLTREWLFLGLVLVVVYSFIYAGTGDTRHRALLYLFWGPTLTLYFSAKRLYAPSLPDHPH